MTERVAQRQSRWPAARLNRKSSMVKGLVLGLIRLYQKTTWFVPKVCRYYPSCSQYTLEAVQHYGAWKGSWMGAKRICRCHPLSPGGHDPVPLPSQSYSEPQVN